MQKLARGSFQNSRIDKALDPPSSIASPNSLHPQLSLFLASQTLYPHYSLSLQIPEWRVQAFDNYVLSHRCPVSMYACRPETSRMGIQEYYPKKKSRGREKCERGKRGRGRGEVTGKDAYCGI